MSIELIPAYGRRYETRDECEADWRAGKDFKIRGGPYTSIRDHQVLSDDYGRILIWWAWPNTSDPIIK